MNDVYCFGGRPKNSLSQQLDKAGFRIVHSLYTEGFLNYLPQCRAVLLHWKTEGDQQVIHDAKLHGIPTVVITATVPEALQASMPYADLYLEAPASDEEIVRFLIDMVPIRTLSRTDRSVLVASK